MSIGYVYLFVMQGTTDPVKVGYTGRDPDTRAAELSRATGTPRRLVVADCWFVTCMERCERDAHAALKRWRPTRKKEWFEVDLEVAREAVGNVCRPHLVNVVHPRGTQPGQAPRTRSKEAEWTSVLRSGDIKKAETLIREQSLGSTRLATALAGLLVARRQTPNEREIDAYGCVVRLLWAVCGTDIDRARQQIWWDAIWQGNLAFIRVLEPHQNMWSPDGRLEPAVVRAVLDSLTHACSTDDHHRANRVAGLLNAQAVEACHGISDPTGHLEYLCETLLGAHVNLQRLPEAVPAVIKILLFCGACSTAVPASVDRFACGAPPAYATLLPMGGHRTRRNVARWAARGALAGATITTVARVITAFAER